MTRKELIIACRDAGFDDRQWKAMTYDSGPYDITCPTLQLEKLVKILTGEDITDGI